MNSLNALWVEKYRPNKLSDMILTKENREYFESIKDEIPNLLLVGTPGIGKTTLARIIVQELLKCQYLYINASDENGIDTIRSKVTSFAQTRSVDGRIKVVILDEMDGLSIDAQRALRNTMEEYSAYTRFVFTANYKHKIIPAIQSRAQMFDFAPTDFAVLSRVIYILEQENVIVDKVSKLKLARLVKGNYRDIRKTINLVQKYSASGTLVIANVSEISELLKTVHTHILEKKVIALRKYLIENEAEFQGDYNNLLNQYLNHVYQSDLDGDRKRSFILTIGEHLYKDVFVVDKEINCFVCFYTLETS